MVPWHYHVTGANSTVANKPNPELQKAVFGHIKSHILEFGYPPTTRDLMAYTGRNSSSHMHSVLRKLEAEGLITMEAGKSRTISLVGYKIALVKNGRIEYIGSYPSLSDAPQFPIHPFSISKLVDDA